MPPSSRGIRSSFLGFLLLIFCTPSIAKAEFFGKETSLSNRRGISLPILGNLQQPRVGVIAYKVPEKLLTTTILDKIHRSGFRFVRLVTSPVPLMQVDMVERNRAIAVVLEQVSLAARYKLSVVVDLHFWSGHHDTAESVINDDVKRHAFSNGVVELARAMNGLHYTALEVLNEPPPCSRSSEIWPLVQSGIVKRIRAAAPNLHLIVTGCGGQLDGLLSLDPTPYVHDQKVLYTFHFYEPFIFTHQQTYFGGHLRSVPFPSRGLPNTAEVAAMLNGADQARQKTAPELLTYLKRREGLDVVAKRLSAAKVWSAKYGIKSGRVLVGEFGTTLSSKSVSTDLAKNELSWIELVRKESEKLGFAWAFWRVPADDSTAFDPKTRFLSPTFLKALNVNKPKCIS